MDSLIILAVLFLLIGPVLAIVALVKISTLESTVRNLRSDMALRASVPLRHEAKVDDVAAENSEALKQAEPETSEKSPGADSNAAKTTEETTAEQIAQQPVLQPVRSDIEKNLTSRWFVCCRARGIALCQICA
jgi:hypothetical protein